MKNKVTTEASYHMLMIFFIVVIFGFVTFMINRDASILVVKPIERMTAMIQKLAGAICILSSSDGDHVDEEESSNLNETKLLENVVSRISTIFDVHQDDSTKDAKNKTKAERMLTGSKSTEVQANGSVFNVVVVENTLDITQNANSNARLQASKIKSGNQHEIHHTVKG
jgi:hypothetical protein